MKQKTLIIVESPTKSKTLAKYLNSEYEVKSSMGHIRDLNPNILSIDIENSYKPYYEILKEKKEIIELLKKESRNSQQILLASDPDREGEAIAYHLKVILADVNDNIFRILFNEITKQSVLKAIKNPLKIDMNKVYSQQMRRLLDRLAGYKISPILQKKIGGRLSAGRVQSIALKLIVERENEIQSFKPEEFWVISAELSGSRKPAFLAKLEKENNKKIKILNKDQNNEIVSELKKNDFILKHIEKKLKKKKPFPPLITSTLQQLAFRNFKFSVKRTMKIAQELYEGITLQNNETRGLITYMRTDSYRLAKQAQNAARQLINAEFGNQYTPKKPNFFSNKAKSQDAHEAIRPTLPFYEPEKIRQFLNDAQYKIYKIIWDRFFTSQMSEAEIEETIFKIKNGKYLFLVKGEIIKFYGYLKLQKTYQKIEQLPDLAENEKLNLIKIIPKQNFTSPPARYSEGSLVKILEDKAIGRPSTYAKIIDTLGRREYVQLEERKFVPTFLGTKVVEYLEDNFKNIMDYNFTANLEKQLDLVSDGKMYWTEGIDSFYQQLLIELEKAKNGQKVELLIQKKCPDCGKELLKKYSLKTNGWFIGCTGYPLCKFTEKDIDNLNGDKKDRILEESCPDCGQPLVERYSKKTKSYFIGCSAYPKCNFTRSSKQDFGNCPQCAKPLTKKFSRKTRRFFVGCSGYPKCNYIKKK